MKKVERERERERDSHVECGGKGQTTGVLGYVYVRKDMVGAKAFGFTVPCWSSK